MRLLLFVIVSNSSSATIFIINKTTSTKINNNGVQYSQKCCAYTALVICPLPITRPVYPLIRKSVGKYHIFKYNN